MHALRLVEGATATAASEGTRSVRPIAVLADQGPEGDAGGAGEPITYQRGSLVYALDGQVGRLKQVVIDEEQAEVRALVVQTPVKTEPVLVPPELVEKSAGGTLLLNVTREQFAAGASRSPRFDPRAFTAADLKTVDQAIPLVFRGDPRRSVARVSRDRLATSAAPLDGETAPRQRSWLRRLARR